MDDHSLIQMSKVIGEGSSPFILLLLAAILFLWWRGEKSSLDNIPSMSRLSMIRHVLTPSGKTLEYLSYLAKTDGPIFTLGFLGQRMVLLTGPETIGVNRNTHSHLDITDRLQARFMDEENIVGIMLRSDKHVGKGYLIRFLHSWLGQGLLTSSGDKWRSRRKILNPAFHYKNLEDFVAVFNANSAILVEKLKKHLPDDFVEIENFISLCTLDIICETALGTSIHAQDGGMRTYIEAVKELLDLFIKRTGRPWLYPDTIYRLSSLYRREQELIAVVHDFSNRVIQERRVVRQSRKLSDYQAISSLGNKKSRNFLDIMLEISEKGDTWTDEDIREEVDTIMVAGQDTTAVTLSWTLFLLGSHSDVQETVIKEQRDIFGGDSREPTPGDLHNMVYLGMVIKEVLRLYPSSFAILRETEETVDIGGYTVPPGTIVLLSLYSANRHPETYPEPNKFDPDRFSQEQSAGRHPYAYVPFSAGPRNCIGQKFAYLELKAVLSSLFRNFRVELVNKKEDIEAVPGVVLRPSQKIKIKINDLVKLKE